LQRGRDIVRRLITGIVVANLLAGFGIASAAPAGPIDQNVIDPAGGHGHVDKWTYEASTGTNEFLVYVPQDWRKPNRLPLYVMVHGCATTAEQQMRANLLNPIADRERFLVAYPDNNGQCWRAVSEDAALEAATARQNITRGGGGDADIIAGITRQVIDAYNVDTERVYMAGMSSGAFQTSATAAAYPELYAAVGVSAGAGYGMAVTCAGYPDGVVPRYAEATVAQMGERAHVMPFFSIGGTVDPLGESGGIAGCARLAYLEWLYANNLLNPGDGPLPPGAGVLLPPGTTGDTYQHDPASTENGQVPDGHAWTKHVARDRKGCQIGERWIVHGMEHYWPGGSDDPTLAAWTDPKAPSASEATWRFFEQFTLSDGNTACTSS
jgi:poly(3-hydroxybutyrate) depolymerase